MSLHLSLFGHPTVQSAIGAAGGLILIALRRWRSGGVLIAAACLWGWLSATPAFAGWLQQRLTQAYPPRSASLYPRAGAIVLVGGGPLPPWRAKWNSVADPALATPLGFVLALYRAGKASHIVLSADRYDIGLLARLLREQGVSADAIHPAGSSASTRQDALLATPVLRRLGATRILLVTYPVHMRRSVATFRHQGFKVTAAPSFDPPRCVVTGPAWRPSRRALGRTRAYLHEYFGLAWYRLRGWAAW